MPDFHRQILEHLLQTASSDDHRRYIRQALIGYQNFFGVMAGTASLPKEPVGLQETFDRILETMDPADASLLRETTVKVVPLSNLQTLSGKRDDYKAVMMSLLADDYFTETKLHGADLLQQTNTFVVHETPTTIPSLFGGFARTVLMHFDRAMIAEIMRGYPVTATMTIVALMQNDQAGVRSLLPKAQFMALGLPVGSPRDDPKSFYVLGNS